MKLTSYENFGRVTIGGKSVLVPYPTQIPDFEFIGREGVIEKALAAWTCLDGSTPLNFRLYGPPGIGKNAIVYELARILKKNLYIINGHEELGPEDIACSATMTSKNTVEYVASPLFAAMLEGGICFFDEIGKAPQVALDPLASVLDDRRTLTSVLAGIHLRASEEFLFCAALNEIEEEGTGLPGFIDERTRPAIYAGYPHIYDIEEILKSRMSYMPGLWIKVLISEFKDSNLSTRMAITLLRYAYRLYKKRNGNSKETSENEIKEYLHNAYTGIDPQSKHEQHEQKTNPIEELTKVDIDDLIISNNKKTVH
jgi:MoxR-like ATPase